MRFVVDEQLPTDLVDWLVEQGHDATHVSELGLRSSTDRTIREAAFSSDAVVISKDSDFVRIRRPKDRVLWLRGGNLRRALFMPRFIEAWPDAIRALEAGEPVVEVSLRP
ncbi:MAG: DUF5615 family PIN-like protein [Caulobacter sp.]|nr:DUF5615 family PIN-like protein [Caulobacter sp.]